MLSANNKILISSCYVIKILKEKKLIPEWVKEDSLLPPDPDHRLIFVSNLESNALSYETRDSLKFNLERYMNYQEMTEAVREGAHARRPTWKSGEKLWSDGKILIHNTPYFGEPFNQAIQGYAYVCEQVDVFATDWELCAAS